jgi:hypothetical protein
MVDLAHRPRWAAAASPDQKNRLGIAPGDWQYL